MGSGVRRVDSTSHYRVRPGPSEKTSREMTAASQRGKTRESKILTTANISAFPSKLRGSWQIETIEVAETIRLGNLASKWGIWKTKFYSPIHILATFFTLNATLRFLFLSLNKRMAFDMSVKREWKSNVTFGAKCVVKIWIFISATPSGRKKERERR